MGLGDFLTSAAGGNIIGSAIGAVGSLIGGGMKNDAAKAQAALQYAHQKEFAQNGIRWKVADAKAAGIHPLAALGSQTFSYNPVAVSTGDGGISEALDRMGQGIERAADAKRLQEERDEAKARQEMQDVFDSAQRQKTLEHLDLQNRFLETQIQGARQQIAKSALPPPMPKVNNESSITSDIKPLLSPARVGNAIILHLNSDISDAITEDMAKNLAVNIAAEAKAGRLHKELIPYVSAREKEALKRGDAVLEYTPPLTFNFLWKQHMKPKKNSDGSVSGKIIF